MEFHLTWCKLYLISNIKIKRLIIANRINYNDGSDKTFIFPHPLCRFETNSI